MNNEIKKRWYPNIKVKSQDQKENREITKWTKEGYTEKEKGASNIHICMYSSTIYLLTLITFMWLFLP
jgi:hypothetical protein